MTNRRSVAPSATTGSQTLDRGLRALEVLADAGRPISITELAEHLEVHRSSAYRILRTLEEHRFALRNEAGLIRLGPRLSALGRRAAPGLTKIAQPELFMLANKLGVTAFITVLDADEVITILSVEPSHGSVNLAQRPGARHSRYNGAPSHAIEASLTAEEHRTIYEGAPRTASAIATKERGYALSQDEVIPGVTSIAIPLRLQGEPPAAIAVVSIGMPEQPDYFADELRKAATRMTQSSW